MKPSSQNKLTSLFAGSGCPDGVVGRRAPTVLPRNGAKASRGSREAASEGLPHRAVDPEAEDQAVLANQFKGGLHLFVVLASFFWLPGTKFHKVPRSSTKNQEVISRCWFFIYKKPQSASQNFV
jgi:hypothetical protein